MKNFKVGDLVIATRDVHNHRSISDKFKPFIISKIHKGMSSHGVKQGGIKDSGYYAREFANSPTGVCLNSLKLVVKIKKTGVRKLIII